jgi:hypothetical protein
MLPQVHAPCIVPKSLIVVPQKIPGYASLPACYGQVTYFLSIRLVANSALEAMRTQRDDFHSFSAWQRDMKALRGLGLTTPFCVDVLAPCTPAKRQIGNVINAWIAFNYIFQADKPTLIWRVGRAA